MSMEGRMISDFKTAFCSDALLADETSCSDDMAVASTQKRHRARIILDFFCISMETQSRHTLY